MSALRAIIGLGNPGSEYDKTRHNAGFWFVDRLAERFQSLFDIWRAGRLPKPVVQRREAVLTLQQAQAEAGLGNTALAQDLAIEANRLLGGDALVRLLAHVLHAQAGLLDALPKSLPLGAVFLALLFLGVWAFKGMLEGLGGSGGSAYMAQRFYAAGTEEDDPAGVALLLKQKAKVDASGRHQRTALHEAVRAGHREIAALDGLPAKTTRHVDERI